MNETCSHLPWDTSTARSRLKAFHPHKCLGVRYVFFWKVDTSFVFLLQPSIDFIPSERPKNC